MLVRLVWQVFGQKPPNVACSGPARSIFFERFWLICQLLADPRRRLTQALGAGANVYEFTNNGAAYMDKDILIDATIQSLCSVKNPRLFCTERGFQGEFFCLLQKILKEQGIVDENCILEMEYQKSVRHGTQQRPDIILHVPVEISRTTVTENNYAVWALKRNASVKSATDDFEKLNDMFSILTYPMGFFINIDSMSHHLDSYSGDFRDRIFAFAVQLNQSDVAIKMAYFESNDITEIEI